MVCNDTFLRVFFGNLQDELRSDILDFIGVSDSGGRFGRAAQSTKDVLGSEARSEGKSA